MSAQCCSQSNFEFLPYCLLSRDLRMGHNFCLFSSTFRFTTHQNLVVYIDIWILFRYVVRRLLWWCKACLYGQNYECYQGGKMPGLFLWIKYGLEFWKVWQYGLWSFKGWGAQSPTPLVLTDQKGTVHFWAVLHIYSVANFVASWLKWLQTISNDSKWLHLKDTKFGQKST